MAPLIEALNRSDIPSSPIYSIADIFQDPQFAARGTMGVSAVSASRAIFSQSKNPSVGSTLFD